MRNMIWTLPLYAVIAAGLMGCSGNEAAENDDFMDNAGYHSTEKGQMVRKIHYQGMEDAVDNLYDKDDAYSKSDRNYHGHESMPLHAKSSYYNAYEGELVNEINLVANGVEHVIDSRTIVMENEMLVALLLDDYDHAQAVKETVRDQVSSMTEGRKLYVSADEGIYYRSMTLDNNLRDGDSRDMIVLDANDMFDNLDIHENHTR